MRKIFLTVSAMVCFLTLGTSAWSLPIPITPTTTPKWTGTDNVSFSAAKVATTVGYSGALVEFYKQDVGVTSDSGSFASSYTTDFFNTADDPEDARITYISGQPFIYGTPLYLYVKDGNQEPAFYIFSLSALEWNGKETIDLDDFWPDQGAISHLAIYGPVPPGQVPEPSVLLLLGIGLVGLASVGRKIRR